MKIDNSLKVPGSAGSDLRPRPARSDKAADSASHTAEVSLSSTTAGLKESSVQAPVDSAKIAAIKLAISEGRFVINPGAIADRLIDTAQELIRTRHPA